VATLEDFPNLDKSNLPALSEDNFYFYEEDDVVGQGGDLTVPTLLDAYSRGAFPFFSAKDPLLWWNPEERFIFQPEVFHLSKRLKRLIRQNRYTVKIDHNFSKTINLCANVDDRNANGDGWILPQMIEAYTNLHNAGYAHSVEVYNGDKLVGGLYGVSLGKAFMGESMFSLESNCSKIALFALTVFATHLNFKFIDAQFHTSHLESLGGETISRANYKIMLKQALQSQTLVGNWGEEFSEVWDLSTLF